MPEEEVQVPLGPTQDTQCKQDGFTPSAEQKEQLAIVTGEI